MSIRRLIPLILLLLGVLDVAHAQDDGPVSTVDVALVRASRDGRGIDDALAPMSRALTALPYARFEALDVASWPSPLREAHSHELRPGLVLVATLTESVDEGATVLVQVTRDGQEVLSTRFQRPWGHAHVLQVGAESGGVLLVPVRVRR